jgi:quinolinate synthase
MNTNIQFLPETYQQYSDEDLHQRIRKIKQILGKDLIILGHHYQQDAIIQHADIIGDSLGLSQQAAQEKDARYIVFCGVHFMAESADILTTPEQTVILPDMDAGCSMANMASLNEVQTAWDMLHNTVNNKIIPITYVNSTADLKAFCGKYDGITCTSSNATSIIKWALERGDRIFFFPDQHLGRNTCYQLGIPLEEMITWDPHAYLGGNTIQAIQNATVILWYGYCSVHQRFTVKDTTRVRQEYPGIKIVVHPECSFDVVQAADDSGSTGKIVSMIQHAESGSRWAIGTEQNLVNRLKQHYQDRLFITPLSQIPCLCATMYRIRLPHLAWTLEKIANHELINQIQVEKETKKWAIKALERMLGNSS